MLIGLFPMTAYSQFVEEQYTLGSGDEIKITVFGQEDLTVETRLSNIGIIRYPFLGDIELVGKTVNEVEQLIDIGLRGDYLINPSVSVTVVEYRPFFINGEVNKPGGYPYQPGLTIDKAAALAGGYTQRADKNDGEFLVRRTVKGSEVNLELNATSIVLPGDILTVKPTYF
ncbi:polysaccharide biosynthesis/export family protein [Glaciecola petra]|uniref:Polysaccharide biosynthesis/export family protein n=1 Tax=Glaciecola petra TaxID=3075602 RepID=A0ABU2ZTN1_9ALTE|nr:polysaccharide biosynthesis/export family protein [Aestuariibacter sp. P117]MDT0595960.1 polysaccharide biosynthesis/export family protein [Aestuariibacter sp. P117]